MTEQNKYRVHNLSYDKAGFQNVDIKFVHDSLYDGLGLSLQLLSFLKKIWFL